MDGLSLKFVTGILDKYFHEDKYGSLIPKAENLRMEDVAQRVERQLSADTGLARRMTEMYWRTDVEFTDNPEGNTPVLGAGLKKYGPRPLKKKSFGTRLSDIRQQSSRTNATIDKRARKIRQDALDLYSFQQSLKPADENTAEHLLWLIEGDQVLTGGGFDGNSIGGVHKSALNFITQSNSTFEYADSELSALVVEGSMWLRDELIKDGIRLGSLGPVGLSTTRFEQDKDGMIGFPVYSRGNVPLTKEIAVRLLIETGVSTIQYVGSSTTDRNSGLTYQYRVIDAIGYILDRMIVDPKDAPSVVTLLARIQKHGWILEGDGVIAKPGKTRSVYPNAAIPGCYEAMLMQSFVSELKTTKSRFMPSLQDKPTRVEMIKALIEEANLKDYDFLAADWSKYDATVKGAILATVMKIAVKPFFKAQYYDWVDAVIYALTYKYLVLDTSIASINSDDFAGAKDSGPNTEVDRYTLFGLCDGLISGAKFTHGGGSMYGEVVIHYVIPKLLGYDPILGPQAGDDTLLGIPKSRIDLTSSEATYGPIAEAAARCGLEMNPSKQIWHNSAGEVVKVFLQEAFHLSLDIWGVGSIFRPLSALFFAERDKGLSISEQLMAEIARMNQGHDNPFAIQAIEYWLGQEQFLGPLFKEYGASAFQVVVETTGMELEALIQRIGVGSFSFGIEKSDIYASKIPILDLIAQVSASQSYVLDAPTILKSLGGKGGENEPVEEEEDLVIE